MRVKICGITTIEDALAACDAGVDALGFNFAAESRAKGRHIEPADAKRIIEQLPPFVTTVGVCVNESLERLSEYLDFVDQVQLHGEEPFEVSRALASRSIKVFRVGADFDHTQVTACPASAYLLDASVPIARGGTGRTCDWNAARRVVELGKPVILAGGLTPDNVCDAIRAVRPHAVDTAGGVERSPGKKDHDKIRDFIRNAKSCVS